VSASGSLKIIFAGTPAFSATTLQALLASKHIVTAVYTQPDRPAGRGRKLTASPVKELALQNDLPVYQPLSLRDANEQKILAEIDADVMVVVAYGLILPLPVLNAPRLGCINIHASLLPRWRGAAHIQRSILAGDALTGITTMQMDVGLDTGDMLHKVECPIQNSDTSETLHDRLADLGANAILKTLDDLAQGSAVPTSQDNSLATYAHKITKEEALIDWQVSAEELSRKIRAFNPWPVAYFNTGAQTIRVWQADVSPTHADNHAPGTIVATSPESIDVATKKGILRLQKLQLPGGRVLPVGDILNSRHDTFVVGKQLGGSL
jgi:methionyl-tRNA formyltransferase